MMEFKTHISLDRVITFEKFLNTNTKSVDYIALLLKYMESFF